MPFIPINYAAIQPMGLPGIRNLPQSLAQGMRLGALPQQLRQEAQHSALANELMGLQTQYLPRQMESQLQLTEANRRKIMQDAAQKEMLTNMLRGVGGGEWAQEGGAPQPSDLRQQLFRKLMGLPAETPQEKQGREMGLFKEKEEFKEKLRGPETQRFKTIQQQASMGIKNTLPMIDKLIESDVPYPLGSALGITTPAHSAQYEARLAGITDSLLSAFQLPKTQESLKTVEKMVRRQPFEGEKDYKKRLNELKMELKSRSEGLRTGKGFEETMTENITARLPIQSQRTLNGINYVKRGGKWYQE